MKTELFQVLKSGDRFYAKISNNSVHEFMKMERTVQVHLSESPANIIDLKTGKFAWICRRNSMPEVYPSSFRDNQKPIIERMNITEIIFWT